MDLTSEDVQDILQLLEGLPFGEMHLQTTRFSLHLRRTADGEWAQELQVLTEPTMTPAASSEDEAASTATGTGDTTAAGAAVPAASGSATQDGPEPDGPELDGLCAVRAPLPGTFYRAPMPGAPPFVDVGSHVEPDTVVGIVETMKLMNSVPAGVSGTVAQIPLANAQFTERGAVLIWIREHR
jgi:acetyl-CoA carboxylase biotin carboxyl carrier protein